MGQRLAANMTVNTSEESTQTYNNQNGLNSNANNETQNPNETNVSNGREVITINETCIDLTEDESVINENSVESDSEIQCITAIIRNPPNNELAIIKETNINRRRRTTIARERSRSPINRREQSDEIVVLTNSQSNDRILT
jgi:hypothetical protein